MIGADAGTFAAATTSDRQSLTKPLVRWRSFEPGERADVRSNDSTSHSEPSEVKGPLGVESPSKIGPAGSIVVVFTTSAASFAACPSETTKSRLALPPEYGTPAMVWSHPAESNVLATFESFPLNMT